MPGKNTLKQYAPQTYYHVYNRGWNQTDIFIGDEDYIFFESLLARHLSPTPTVDSRGRNYRHFYGELHLLAYCLMPNHLHFLVYQYNNERAIANVMSSVCIAYTMYFNQKYGRRGPLFENTYKAVLITSDEQLLHITRYIHLNHPDFRTWDWSSYQDYIRAGSKREWVDNSPILQLFSSAQKYQEFVEDYESLQREREVLKKELADS